jgi:hypothetical protein
MDKKDGVTGDGIGWVSTALSRRQEPSWKRLKDVHEQTEMPSFFDGDDRVGAILIKSSDLALSASWLVVEIYFWRSNPNEVDVSS